MRGPDIDLRGQGGLLGQRRKACDWPKVMDFPNVKTKLFINCCSDLFGLLSS
jgi:hypothetical protein